MRRPFLVALLSAAAFVAAPLSASAAFIPADVVFLIDTSGSMGDDINQVKARIGQFDTALVNAGIDANYALVRFGGTETLAQQLTTFSDFNRAGGPFQTLSASGGGTERGSQAGNVALSQVTFRTGSVKNFILITDEDDDSTLAQYNALDAGLTANNVLFNTIYLPGNGGIGTLNDRYRLLAVNHGGQAFNILNFRNNPGPFFDNFIETKVREIVNQANPVPVPPTAALAVLGVGAVRLLRRRATA
jgi:hypothetical protein